MKIAQREAEGSLYADRPGSGASAHDAGGQSPRGNGRGADRSGHGSSGRRGGSGGMMGGYGVSSGTAYGTSSPCRSTCAAIPLLSPKACRMEMLQSEPVRKKYAF